MNIKKSIVTGLACLLMYAGANTIKVDVNHIPQIKQVYAQLPDAWQQYEPPIGSIDYKINRMNAKIREYCNDVEGKLYYQDCEQIGHTFSDTGNCVHVDIVAYEYGSIKRKWYESLGKFLSGMNLAVSKTLYQIIELRYDNNINDWIKVNDLILDKKIFGGEDYVDVKNNHRSRFHTFNDFYCTGVKKTPVKKNAPSVGVQEKQKKKDEQEQKRKKESQQRMDNAWEDSE